MMACCQIQDMLVKDNPLINKKANLVNLLNGKGSENSSKMTLECLENSSSNLILSLAQESLESLEEESVALLSLSHLFSTSV